MRLYTARVRRATIAVVASLRRDGESINRTTVGAAMGVSGPCAAHRLKVLAEMGAIKVDPIPRRKPLPRAERAALLEAAVASRRAEGVWL